MRCSLWAEVAALLSALGAFLFGLDIGYIAPILQCASFKRDVLHIDDPDVPVSDVTTGFIVGVFSLGCVLTSFPIVSGYCLRHLGRRDSIVVGTVVFLVGCLLQAGAGSLHAMLAGRLVAGLSIGLLSPVVALYQSEVSPPKRRGALTSLYQLMVTFGVLVATVADHELVQESGGWRKAILMQVFPAAALLLGMPMLPRSPRWLLQQGRKEEALQALRSLRDSEAEALEELQEIAASCAADAALGAVRWQDLLGGFMLRLLALGMALQMLQQLVGMNAFMYFGPRIFGDLGLDENKCQVLLSTVNFLATFPAILCADRFGRRFLLVWGAAGMGAACFVMGYLGCFLTKQVGDDLEPLYDAVPTGLLAMVFFFVICFAASWGPIVWVYTAEIYPLKYRGWCMGLTTTSNWVGNFAIAQLTPILLGTLGFGTFFLFGVSSLVALLLALWLPETKGVLLEHMDLIFEDKFGVPASSRSALEGGRVPPSYGTAGDAAEKRPQLLEGKAA